MKDFRGCHVICKHHISDPTQIAQCFSVWSLWDFASSCKLKQKIFLISQWFLLVFFTIFISGGWLGISRTVHMTWGKLACTVETLTSYSCPNKMEYCQNWLILWFVRLWSTGIRKGVWQFCADQQKALAGLGGGCGAPQKGSGVMAMQKGAGEQGLGQVGSAVPSELSQRPGANCARGMALLRCLHSLITPASVNNTFVSNMAATKKLCKCSVRLAWTSSSEVNHALWVPGSPLENDRGALTIQLWPCSCFTVFQLI